MTVKWPSLLTMVAEVVDRPKNGDAPDEEILVSGLWEDVLGKEFSSELFPSLWIGSLSSSLNFSTLVSACPVWKVILLGMSEKSRDNSYLVMRSCQSHRCTCPNCCRPPLACSWWGWHDNQCCSGNSGGTLSVITFPCRGLSACGLSRPLLQAALTIIILVLGPATVAFNTAAHWWTGTLHILEHFITNKACDGMDALAWTVLDVCRLGDVAQQAWNCIHFIEVIKMIWVWHEISLSVSAPLQFPFRPPSEDIYPWKRFTTNFHR